MPRAMSGQAVLGFNGYYNGPATFGNPVQVQGPSGTNRLLFFQTGSLNRVGIGINSSVESGGSAGSNFIINLYDDTGALIDLGITIQRLAGGSVVINRPLQCNFQIKTLVAIQYQVWTVGTLPAGATGLKAMVSDALAPVFGSAVAGGGAVTVPVYWNGSAWFVG